MEQINPINKVTLKDKMKSYTRHPGSLILLLLVLTAAALTVVTLLFWWVTFSSAVFRT